MDLIEMKDVLDEKESKKNKLIGKGEIYVESLKKLGFKSEALAAKGLEKNVKALDDKKVKHVKKVTAFQKKYGNLINA